jgi:hypothetical protein
MYNDLTAQIEANHCNEEKNYRRSYEWHALRFEKRQGKGYDSLFKKFL